MSTQAAEVIAPSRKRLTDLYIVGEEVVFEDGTDDPIVVWLQKLSPDENQLAAEAAKPVKATVSSIKRLPEDDPEKLKYYDFLDQATMTSKLDKLRFLVKEKVDQYRESTESRIAAEKEWSEDDYLLGLQEAWKKDLKDRWVEDPSDEEANRVYEELLRYTKQVEEEVEAEENELIFEIQDLSEAEVDKRVVNRLIENEANRKMIEEFQIQQIYYATRFADDHSKRYFDSRDELRSLSGPVINKLLLTYMQMSVSILEGKE